MKRGFQVTCLLCYLWGMQGAQDIQAAPLPSVRAAYDVVTLKNGNTYNGAVARPSFRLRTEYGTVSVPYGMMKDLVAKPDGDRIITHDGERFTGQLLHDDLRVLRVLGPTLPVAWSDIRHVGFARRRTHRLSFSAPDQLWLRNGDRMVVKLRSLDVLVQSPDGIKMVPASKIRSLESRPVEGAGYPRVVVRFRESDEALSGLLLSNSLNVELRYGALVEIPASSIRLLALQMNEGREIGGRFPEMRIFGVPREGVVRDELRSGGSGPELLMLDGGSYRRGDPAGDTDERPPQQLNIAPFAISLFEVTFDEYDRFCDRTDCEKPEDDGRGRGSRPVVNVSWEDAKAYVKWLSAETGKRYRLPTDGEWEFAARAGSTTKFPWGDEVGTARANCEGCGSLWEGESSTTVGRFPPNAFGLYDMTGNVWEWVEDCYTDRFADGPPNGDAVEKPGCGKRVIRGGAWSFPPKEMRSANRWRDFPSRHSDDTGFRVVRE